MRVDGQMQHTYKAFIYNYGCDTM